MQKHCIANTTFLFRGLCILGKSTSDIHAPRLNRWGIIVKNRLASIYKAVFAYSRSESNRDRQNRNLKFYPLNYGSISERLPAFRMCKVKIISEI